MNREGGRMRYTWEDYCEKYGEDEIMRRAEEGLFDGVTESWCTCCGNDVRTEPDADTTYCYECQKVTKVDNPSEMIFLAD
jgi:hypothetical protein